MILRFGKGLIKLHEAVAIGMIFAGSAHIRSRRRNELGHLSRRQIRIIRKEHCRFSGNDGSGEGRAGVGRVIIPRIGRTHAVSRRHHVNTAVFGRAFPMGHAASGTAYAADGNHAVTGCGID